MNFDFDHYEIVRFSIKNNLRKSISRISYVWIVYDDDGEPVDYREEEHYGEIKAKLAKRTYFKLPRSVVKFIDKSSVPRIWDNVEIRNLDFRIIEE